MKKLFAIIILFASSISFASSTTVITIVDAGTENQVVQAIDSPYKIEGYIKLRNYLDKFLVGSKKGVLSIQTGTRATRTYRFGN